MKENDEVFGARRWDRGESRNVMGEDIKSILEGTLQILRIYTNILNVVSPKSLLVDPEKVNKVISTHALSMEEMLK